MASRSRRSPPTALLGPIPLARGVQGGRWRVSVLFLMAGDDEPPDLAVAGLHLAVPPRFLKAWPARPDGTPAMALWRYDFAAARSPQDVKLSYGLVDDGRQWAFTVPGTVSPRRLAFTACNGCEDESELSTAGLPRNRMWADLLGRHRLQPFHMLLGGGDQIYADALWREVPGIRGATGKRAGGGQIDLGGDVELALDFWYLDRYRHAWGQPEVAALLPTLPLLCMWDDHDIIDGWGSLPEAVLESPLNRKIFESARTAFRLFQLGQAGDDTPETICGPPGTHSQLIRFDGLGLLVPDLRAERRPDRILSEETWSRLPAWLRRLEGCRHLFLMMSVPLVYPGLGTLERTLGALPFHVGLEDDLRDQWRSPAHRGEWRRMVELLTGFSRRTGIRVTLLSGEVHHGAVGMLRANGAELLQLISSGIVHPPPGALLGRGLEAVAARRERPEGDIITEMIPFAETGRRILRARNWLSLVSQPDGSMLAEWHAETGPTPLTFKVPADTPRVSFG